jgi:uncharacterized protein
MEESSGFCLGCLRTIDEIIGWGSRSDAEKREILALVKLRKDTAGYASSSISHANKVDKTP